MSNTAHQLTRYTPDGLTEMLLYEEHLVEFHKDVMFKGHQPSVCPSCPQFLHCGVSNGRFEVEPLQQQTCQPCTMCSSGEGHTGQGATFHFYTVVPVQGVNPEVSPCVWANDATPPLTMGDTPPQFVQWQRYARVCAKCLPSWFQNDHPAHDQLLCAAAGTQVDIGGWMANRHVAVAKTPDVPIYSVFLYAQEDQQLHPLVPNLFLVDYFDTIKILEEQLCLSKSTPPSPKI